MTPEEIKKLEKHEQILDQLTKNHEELFKFNSKLNGEYTRMDKEAAVYRSSVTQDLDVIKSEIKKIVVTLDTVISGYVKREEFEARFDRIQDEIDSRFLGANERISSKVDTDKFDEHSRYMTEKIDSLIDNQKWVTRIIIGAVLMALLGLVFVK